MAMFKRKRVYAPRSNAFKKRKSTRRRNFRRKGGPRNVGYTSLNQKDHVFGFRTKKVSRRRFNNFLWNSTLFSTHYRSVLSALTAPVTPASGVTGTIFGINMHRIAANQFWTTAGGLIQTDAGVTAPTFKGDIILRGGQYEVQFQNSSSTLDIRIKIWLVKTVTNPDFTFEPTLPPIGWDPTSSPDFIKEIGKPFMAREVTLEQGNSYTMKGRFKLQKIDQTTYNSQGNSIVMYVMLCNVGHAVSTTVGILSSHNMSFSADAIT